MVLLHSKDDFEWYKLELDLKYKHHNLHKGEPIKYPCVVNSSDRIDEDNEPYYFIHTFTYDEYFRCKSCGNDMKIKDILKGSDTL